VQSSHHSQFRWSQETFKQGVRSIRSINPAKTTQPTEMISIPFPAPNKTRVLNVECMCVDCTPYHGLSGALLQSQVPGKSRHNQHTKHSVTPTIVEAQETTKRKEKCISAQYYPLLEVFRAAGL
jgi:hypothetical protein